MTVLAVFVSLLFTAINAQLDSCLQSCLNSTNASSRVVQVCGVSTQSYNQSYAIDAGLPACFFACNFSAQFPLGTGVSPGCECPNQCYAAFQFGLCSSQLSPLACRCNTGRRGVDCGLVQCPSSCSGHGTCASSPAGDYCACEDGWSGLYCQTAALTDVFPFFAEYPDTNGQYVDSYSGDHPLFNKTVLATIEIGIDPALLSPLLLTLNASFASINFSFNNGIIISPLLTGVTMRQSFETLSPTSPIPADYWKRNLRLAFDANGTSLFGVREFTLSRAYNTFSLQTSSTTSEFMRAMQVPQQRNSWARVIVNGVNWGTYSMLESVDDAWLGTFWKNGSGNFYQGLLQGTLEYRGNDSTAYSNYVASDQYGRNVSVYTQIGNGNWSRFIDLCRIIDPTQTSDSAFASSIRSVLNLNQFYRFLLVEMVASAWSGYSCSSTNFGLYDNPDTGLFEMIGFDWTAAIYNLDTTLSDPNLTWATLSALQFCNVSLETGQASANSPLTRRVLANSQFRAEFSGMVRTFLDVVFVDPTDLTSRLTTISAFLASDFAYDQFSPLDFPALLTNQANEVASLSEYLSAKYDSLSAEFPVPDDPQFWVWWAVLLVVLFIIIFVFLVLSVMPCTRHIGNFV